MNGQKFSWGCGGFRDEHFDKAVMGKSPGSPADAL